LIHLETSFGAPGIQHNENRGFLYHKVGGSGGDHLTLKYLRKAVPGQETSTMGGKSRFAWQRT